MLGSDVKVYFSTKEFFVDSDAKELNETVSSESSYIKTDRMIKKKQSPYKQELLGSAYLHQITTAPILAMNVMIKTI